MKIGHIPERLEPVLGPPYQPIKTRGNPFPAGARPPGSPQTPEKGPGDPPMSPWGHSPDDFHSSSPAQAPTQLCCFPGKGKSPWWGWLGLGPTVDPTVGAAVARPACSRAAGPRGSHPAAVSHPRLQLLAAPPADVPCPGEVCHPVPGFHHPSACPSPSCPSVLPQHCCAGEKGFLRGFPGWIPGVPGSPTPAQLHFPGSPTHPSAPCPSTGSSLLGSKLQPWCHWPRFGTEISVWDHLGQEPPFACRGSSPEMIPQEPPWGGSR